MTATATGIAFATLPEGQLLERPAGDRTIGLLRRGDRVFAFAPKCPHAGAPLCEGWLDAQGRVVCPLHTYRFDPANGRNTSGEGYKLRTFPTEIRDGEVWVTLP